jgi:hypothetical protein
MYPSRTLSDDDHRHLADALHALRGMAVVSGYACPLYRELYAGWSAVARPARTHGPRAATEVLWLSPRAAERLAARQLPLPEEAPPEGVRPGGDFREGAPPPESSPEDTR